MSETEQSDGQSLEDILSSIRKKISADPDMADVSSQPSSAFLNAGLDTASRPQAGASGTDGVGLAQSVPMPQNPVGFGSPFSGSGSDLNDKADGMAKPTTDVVADRLSDMLSGVEPAQPIVSPSVSQAEDDLSDILDDPLPAPLESGSAGDKPARGDASVVTGNVLGPGIAGLPASGKTTGGSGVEPNADRANPEPGMFIPKPLGEPAQTNPQGGGLAAKLRADVDVVESGEGKFAKGKQAFKPASSLEDTLQNIPRSMSSLSSGFALPVSGDSAPAENEKGGASSLKSESGSDGPAVVGPGKSSVGVKNEAEEAVGLKVAFATPAASPAVAMPPETKPAKADLPVGGAENGITAEASPGSVQGGPSVAPKKVDASSLGAAAAATSLASGKTLEDAVSELLRPMLHEWLEANLPRIVENALRIEVLEASAEGGSDDKG